MHFRPEFLDTREILKSVEEEKPGSTAGLPHLTQSTLKLT
jgi:hypothetical protein